MPSDKLKHRSLSEAVLKATQINSRVHCTLHWSLMELRRATKTTLTFSALRKLERRQDSLHLTDKCRLVLRLLANLTLSMRDNEMLLWRTHKLSRTIRMPSSKSLSTTISSRRRTCLVLVPAPSWLARLSSSQQLAHPWPKALWVSKIAPGSSSWQDQWSTTRFVD